MSNAMTLGPIGTRRPTRGKSVQFSVHIPLDQLERLDAWRGRQLIVPSRMEVIRQIIREFLERVEAK